MPISYAQADDGEGESADETAETKPTEGEGETVSESDETTSDGTVTVPKVEVQAEKETQSDETTREPSASIDSDDLKRRSVTDLEEALEVLAMGTSTNPTGTAAGLIVDGLPASQVTVLENGLPVSRRQAGRGGPMVDLSAIPVDPEGIERIEVYRGAGPAGSGGTGGVVINIVTSRERSASAFGRARAGGVAWQHHRRHFEFGGESPIGDRWFGSGRGGHDFRRALDVDGDGTFDTPRRRGWSAQVGGAWRPTRRDSLRLQVDGVTTRTAALGDPESPLYDRVATRNLGIRLQGNWRPSGLWRVRHGTSFDLYDHEYRKVVRSSDVERLKADTEQLRAVQNVVATRYFDSHDLSLELYGSTRRLRRTGEDASLGTKVRGAVGLGVADTYYVSDDLRLSGRLFGDVSTEFGLGWTGQLGAAWDVADGWTAKATLSRTRRLPTTEERYLFFDHSELGYRVRGDDSLVPERLRSGRIGVSYRNDDRTVTAHVGGFYHRLSNLITTEPTGTTDDGIAIFEYTNIANAHTAGLNAGVGLEELPGGLEFEGRYAWLPVAHDRRSGERLPLRSAHAGRIELRRDFWGETLEIWSDLEARSARPVPRGAGPAPGYALLGVGVAYRPYEFLELTVDADNLLDRTNPVWGPKPGVTVLATLEVRYEAATSGSGASMPKGDEADSGLE